MSSYLPGMCVMCDLAGLTFTILLAALHVSPAIFQINVAPFFQLFAKVPFNHSPFILVFRE